MIYIIFPKDDTTKFLFEIIETIQKKIGLKDIEIININPSDESYENGISFIQSIPESSIIIFMGHGQNDILFGGEDVSFKKKAFIKKNEMRIFEGKHVFLLSCYSNELLKSSFSFSNITSSVGFGVLPTEMIEVENNKKLKEQGLTEDIIIEYKNILVDITASSICYLIKSNSDLFSTSNYFSLLINKKISQIILEDKESANMRILANLLFQMRTEMVFI